MCPMKTRTEKNTQPINLDFDEDTYDYTHGDADEIPNKLSIYIEETFEEERSYELI
jgi:hypothetical protein